LAWFLFHLIEEIKPAISVVSNQSSFELVMNYNGLFVGGWRLIWG
jgi:hypothetical protein